MNLYSEHMIYLINPEFVILIVKSCKCIGKN